MERWEGRHRGGDDSMTWWARLSPQAQREVKLVIAVLRPTHIWDYDTRRWRRLK